MRTPEHYRHGWRTRAKLIVRAAVLNPMTICWRCGLTMAEIRALNPGRTIKWQAGHTDPGNSAKPSLAEHSLCNTRAGQGLKQSNQMAHSKRWAT